MSDTETPGYAQNSLAEAISLRIPTIWVSTPDVVEVIDKIHYQVLQYPDLDLYLFNATKGLQVYDRTWKRFHTVMVEVEKPDLNLGIMVKVHVPLLELGEAFGYLETNLNASLIIANPEAYNDELNSFYTFMNLSWRAGWSNDNARNVGFQVLLVSSVESAPPEAVRAYVPTVSFGYPTHEEFITIATYVKEKTKSEFDVEEIARASRGLTLFESISLYHSETARHGTINKQTLEDITFQRLAQRAGLDIFRPSVDLDDVAGAENIKKILETSIWLRDNKEEAKKLGFDTPLHRFLLLGLPGVGKSFLCEAAAKTMNLNLIRTGLTHMLSKFHGESEQNVKALFQQIAALDPVCVWFDEFGRDAGGGQSSHVVDGGTTSRTHGLFLTALQELSESTYFFAAANDISSLAPEMLRADRFDKIFFVGFPTFEQRHQIITGLLKDRECDINVNTIASATGAYTGAEIKTALATAGTYALADRRAMNTDDVMNALTRMKGTLWKSNRGHVMNSYKEAYNSYEWASDDQRAEATEYGLGNVPTGRPKVIKGTSPNVEGVSVGELA